MLTLLKDRVINGCFVIKDRVIKVYFVIKDRVIRHVRAIIIKIINVKNHKNHLVSHYFLLPLPQITIINKGYEHINSCDYSRFASEA